MQKMNKKQHINNNKSTQKNSFVKDRKYRSWAEQIRLNELFGRDYIKIVLDSKALNTKSLNSSNSYNE